MAKKSQSSSLHKANEKLVKTVIINSVGTLETHQKLAARRVILK